MEIRAHAWFHFFFRVIMHAHVCVRVHDKNMLREISVKTAHRHIRETLRILACTPARKAHRAVKKNLDANDNPPLDIVKPRSTCKHTFILQPRSRAVNDRHSAPVSRGLAATFRGLFRGLGTLELLACNASSVCGWPSWVLVTIILLYIYIYIYMYVCMYY